MEFNELVRQRHSVRDYDPDRPVDREILNRILENGRLAPSAANRQPWKFLVISSPAMLEKVHRCYDREWFRMAPHVLIVLGNAEESWTRAYEGYNSIETDVTIAMDHLILAAANEGVGTCWIAAFKPDILEKALKLKSNERVFAITPLGYPHEDYQPKKEKIRKPLSDIIEFL